jgi:hypothetical protein
MTVDLCQAQVGQLSPHQLSQGRELMKAWSHLAPPREKIDCKECVLAVEQLVKRVIDEKAAGNEAADLTTEDYNCLLEGWARSQQGPAAAERCEQILEQMQLSGPSPDLASFKACLMAWRQSGDSSASYCHHRVQRLLEWMIQLCSKGDNVKVLPDADCFDIVLQTWSRSGDPQAPKQTEQIVGLMERLHKSTGSERLKPRRTSFNAVLAAWSKSTNSEAAAHRVAAILSFMELRAAQGDVTVLPDSASYNTVIQTIAQSQDARTAAAKADDLLNHVNYNYRVDSTKALPDTILFNTAMGLWAKTGQSGAYRKARSILDKQLSLYDKELSEENGRPERCKPDVFGYTSVIASCASEAKSKSDTEERQKAFGVAVGTYRQLQKSDLDDPNHVTYGTMLKATMLLPKEQREKWVRSIFQDAVQAGCVGGMVVSKLREVAGADLYKELMNGHRKRLLPSEWTRNVQENNVHRKRSLRRRKRAEV